MVPLDSACYFISLDFISVPSCYACTRGTKQLTLCQISIGGDRLYTSKNKFMRTHDFFLKIWG